MCELRWATCMPRGRTRLLYLGTLKNVGVFYSLTLPNQIFSGILYRTNNLEEWMDHSPTQLHAFIHHSRSSISQDNMLSQTHTHQLYLPSSLVQFCSPRAVWHRQHLLVCLTENNRRGPFNRNRSRLPKESAAYVEMLVGLPSSNPKRYGTVLSLGLV